MKKVLLLLLIGAVFIINASAQGFDALVNPQISVKLMHPPGLGFIVNKVVFNPGTGIRSDQVIDVLIGIKLKIRWDRKFMHKFYKV